MNVMKTNMQKLQEQKFLTISLFVIAFGVLITNLISEDTAILFTSWSYILFAFGIYDHFKIFITTKETSQNNREFLK